ncbi:hypothetical protein [Sphingobacterium puteale]|uniref:hypothetical protein n=1 Tax=Sphingobacterium puteale TaxID=2420510 RepID=UPI0015FF64CD|nr:hypothetical protein [Sphingobacterium puteale]
MKTFLRSIYFIVFLGFTMQNEAQTKEEAVENIRARIEKALKHLTSIRPKIQETF